MTQDARVYTALNVVALVFWILLLMEWFSWSRSPVTDYGSALGPVTLFFLIPLAVIGARWLRWRRPQPRPRSRWGRHYLHASMSFLAATWIVSWTPMVFWIGIFSAIASHKWPINLREGPDTAFAKEGFQVHFGFAPAGVDGLYYRRGWEFGDGNTHRMKFHFRDPATIGSIVRAVGLEPLPEGELAAVWVVESEPPDWWPTEGVSRSAQVFRSHSQPRLWVDREMSTAYYRSWP